MKILTEVHITGQVNLFKGSLEMIKTHKQVTNTREVTDIIISSYFNNHKC